MEIPLTHPMSTGSPPRWASSWGQDDLGVFVGIRVDDAHQRLRFIPPGGFVMGSPRDEHQRVDHEPTRDVILTRGFWLADTACTQAVWLAAMGSNPSRLFGTERPVESVSHHDVLDFLTTLRARIPGFAPRLPTEAEWEYACRAGTRTPFSFGANVGTDEVNYDGDFPYAGAVRGVDRHSTVPVGSLPPNRWGLHEMHGNVYEWCHDWYGPYPAGPAVDPTGPTRGNTRVIRGGGWASAARMVRSAHRDSNAPTTRSGSIGFRIAHDAW